MLDSRFMLPMSRLSDRNMLTGECAVATKGKTVVLVTACYKCCLHYALSVKAFVCCFEFSAYSYCSQLNTSEMFWIRLLKVDI